MTTPNEYAEKIVRKFMNDITDHVFLNIQNNEELMREYQTQVHQHSLQIINTSLGKAVKNIFQLDNGDECPTPKSWLIKRYTQHKKSK